MQSQPILIQRNDGPGLLIRVVYFILLGWWFSAIWAVAAWILCLTIIGLPFGLYMLNRLPQVVTLRPSRSDLVLTTTGRIIERDIPQLPFLLRAVYFLLIGWWLSAVWITIAWALNASIIGMVIGFWMFDRVPALITLSR